LKCGRLNPEDPPNPDNPNPDPDPVPTPDPVDPPEPEDPPPPEFVPLVPGLPETGCIWVIDAARSHVTMITATSESRIVFEANNYKSVHGL